MITNFDALEKILAPHLAKVQGFLRKSNGFPKEKLAFDDKNTYIPQGWLNGNKEVKSLEAYLPQLMGKPEANFFMNLDWNESVNFENFVKLEQVVYFALSGAAEYVIASYFMPKIKSCQKVTPKEIFESAFYTNYKLNLKENCDCVCTLLNIMLETYRDNGIVEDLTLVYQDDIPRPKYGVHHTMLQVLERRIVSK